MPPGPPPRDERGRSPLTGSGGRRRRSRDGASTPDPGPENRTDIKINVGGGSVEKKAPGGTKKKSEGVTVQHDPSDNPDRPPDKKGGSNLTNIDIRVGNGRSSP